MSFVFPVRPDHNQSLRRQPFMTVNIRRPQKIPGKLQCAYYDFGGEGIAYHDTDAKIAAAAT